ncbi:MAG: hypothetical protein JSU87_14375 [Gemmatimonadota bacterium]|nr:MAG: hypothetical protein JSU87_14375 [Gemmatimonadota bacterium]
MLGRLRFLLPALAIWSCSTSGGVRDYPVPEDAENPIRIEYRDGAPAAVVPIVAKVCSDVPIPTQQVDPSRGYVESRWLDIASYRRADAQIYSLREREVYYGFQASEGEEGVGVLEITAYYQPNRPSSARADAGSRYDRLVPTDHPAYQLLLQLEARLRTALREAGFDLVATGESW